MKIRSLELLKAGA